MPPTRGHPWPSPEVMHHFNMMSAVLSVMSQCSPRRATLPSSSCRFGPVDAHAMTPMYVVVVIATPSIPTGSAIVRKLRARFVNLHSVMYRVELQLAHSYYYVFRPVWLLAHHCAILQLHQRSYWSWNTWADDAAIMHSVPSDALVFRTQRQ